MHRILRRTIRGKSAEVYISVIYRYVKFYTFMEIIRGQLVSVFMSMLEIVFTDNMLILNT